jgi:hypothetical protein
MMNTDQKLRQLLTEAADSYDPPSAPPKTRWHQPWGRMAAIGAVAVAVLVALGVLISHAGGRSDSSASSSSSAASSGVSNGAAPARPADAVAGKTTESQPQALASMAAGGATSATSGTPATTVAGQAARVVQTGQLALEVKRGLVRTTLDKLGSIADGAGGFVSQSRADDTSDTPSGTTTLRIPVAGFSGVTAQVRKLGTITSASSSARDVTAQYVDLTARISALQQTRDAFYTLLTKANTIGDTLAVQQQITTVQTQLEQLQGQQKVLGDSSDLATLSVSVTQKGTPVVATEKHTQGGFSKALHQAGHAFNTGLQGVITALGPVLLVLIVLGILAGFGLLGRRIYRHYTRPATR